MEELKKCYQKLNELIQEIENRHEVRIDDFINLDDDIQAECMGDWTENDVKGYLYLADRAATVRKAYDRNCIQANFFQKSISNKKSSGLKYSHFLSVRR